MSRVFDGTQTGANQEIIIAPTSAAYDNLSTFTWSTWVYPTGLGGNEFGTVLIKDATVNYAKFLMFNANGTTTLMAGVNGTVSTASTTAQVTLALNAWSNVIITFDFSGDKKVHMYINGVETVDIGSTTIGGTVQADSGSGFYMGGDTFDDGWTGNLAEFAVWNTALTGAQITAVAAATNGVASIQSANLVGYWHLCGTMSPEPDVSGNGNSGVLSTNPPTKGADSPGFNCSGTPPVTLPWSSTDSRNYGNFPNASREVNQTKTYDVQTSSNPAVPGTDSRAAGAPVDCRIAPNIPENSRTPGLYGPGEN